MSMIDFLLEHDYQVTVAKDQVVLKTPDGKNKTIKHDGDYDSAIREWLSAQEIVGPEIAAIIDHVKHVLEDSGHSSSTTFEYKEALCLVSIPTTHKPRAVEDGIKITVQTNMRVLDDTMYESRLEEIILAISTMACDYTCVINKLPTVVGGTYRFECIFKKN